MAVSSKLTQSDVLFWDFGIVSERLSLLVREKRHIKLWVRGKAGVWREKEETDVHPEADMEKPCGEGEEDSVRVLVSGFHFLSLSPHRSPSVPQDTCVLTISTTTFFFLLR